MEELFFGFRIVITVAIFQELMKVSVVQILLKLFKSDSFTTSGRCLIINGRISSGPGEEFCVLERNQVHKMKKGGYNIQGY